MATENTTTGHKNPDAITGAPGSHPGATGIGSGSGALTGAALGAIGGPVGAIIGGIAGAIVGGGVGHAAGEANDPSDDAYWKDEYKNRSYYDKSHDYDQDVAPAYQYGSKLAAPTSATSSVGTTATPSTFDKVEDTAKQGWEKVKGSSKLSYDQVRSHVRDAYDRKVTHYTSGPGTVTSTPTTTSGTSA